MAETASRKIVADVPTPFDFASTATHVINPIVKMQLRKSMTHRCEYCNGSIAEGGIKCAGCGAPIVHDSAIPDFRSCPFCRRRLLALGSPACSYCGRRLPDNYIRAREADLRRLTEVKAGDETGEVGRKVDELIRQTSTRRQTRGSSLFGLIDITRFIDRFR